jgi:hypothetical protein
MGIANGDLGFVFVVVRDQPDRFATDTALVVDRFETAAGSLQDTFAQLFVDSAQGKRNPQSNFSGRFTVGQKVPTNSSQQHT